VRDETAVSAARDPNPEAAGGEEYLRVTVGLELEPSAAGDPAEATGSAIQGRSLAGSHSRCELTAAESTPQRVTMRANLAPGSFDITT